MRKYNFAPSSLLVVLLLAPNAWSQPALAEQPTTTSQPAMTAAQPAETAAAVTDDQPASAEVVIKDDATPAQQATKTKGSSGADTLTVDFPDEDIRNILRNVADLFELNLVVPDTLQGRTSIKLRDVTWQQIFQVVLSPVGFTYLIEGNIIKIISNESLLQEPVTTEVFIVNYAKAADIMPTIISLVDATKGGKIVVDARSNALVITERPSQMVRIRPIIEQLDKATDQVMIESKFVEVTEGNIHDLGLDWTVNASAGVGQDYARNQSNTYDKSRTNNNGRNSNTNNTLNSTGNGSTGFGFDSSNTQNNTFSSSSGSSTTATPPIGATVTSYSPTTTNTSATGNVVGTTLNTVSAVASDAAGFATGAAAGASSSVMNLFNSSATSGLNSAVFSNYEFGVILKALETSQSTKLVSNPTVVTLNNAEATINIGKEYPIPSYTYNQQTGAYEVSGFEFRPIGIILKVTPQVNARGFIRLTIEPEVSSSSESASFGNANIPIITTRKTKTQVSLKDGYTMGIGGLIDKVSTNNQTRLPILGSIPVLGRLFRSDSVSEDTRNLIIFITAKTVNADGAPIEEVFSSQQVKNLQMRRADLPGYRDGSDPFLPDVEIKEVKK